jgi:hypothetical protein
MSCIIFFSILYNMGFWPPIGLATNALVSIVGKQKTEEEKNRTLSPSQLPFPIPL